MHAFDVLLFDNLWRLRSAGERSRVVLIIGPLEDVLSNSIFQTMAREKLVVATAVDRTVEQIDNGENGLALPLKDPPPLADTIARLPVHAP
jgi:glycosyltransferase involved in cell wall biosynthesis